MALRDQRIEELQGSTWEQRFRTALESFCALTRAEGIHLKPCDEQRPFEAFRHLPSMTQASVVRHFETYLEACVRARAEGFAVRDDSRTILWGLIRKLGLRPSSDLFDKLQDGDVIEVYGADFIQVYRNLQFLELCSYSLDRIFSEPWFELFSRPQSVTDKLMADAQSVLDQRHRGTLVLDPQEHIVEEVSSEERRRFVVRQGIVSPLYGKDGSVDAFVITLRAKLSAPLGN